MAERGAGAFPPIRLVVMDDNEGIVTLLRLNAEFDERFEVVASASDGAEAIELSRQLRPEVVVLDNLAGDVLQKAPKVPAMSGMDAIVELRSLLPDVFVVMYSGERPPPKGANGVDLYVVKGDASPAMLFDLIASAVGRRD